MMPIIEEVKTKAPPKKVWKAWADTYNTTNIETRASSSQKSFREGKKGHIRDKSGKKATYRITNLIQGKTFTMSWGNIFFRMYFRYLVTPQTKGAIVSCKVKFGGLFVFPVSFFLRKKIRKNLSESLHRFVQQVEMQMPQRRVYR